MCESSDRPACSCALCRPLPKVSERVSNRAEWCRSCSDYRIYDVLPGHPESKLYGRIPSMAFCCFCGWWMDVDIEESA